MRLLLEKYRFQAGDNSADDLQQIAAAAIRNGEAVTLLTSEDPRRIPQLPNGMTLRRLPVKQWLPGWANYKLFARHFAGMASSDNYDVSIAFDEMPGADFHIPRQFAGNLHLTLSDVLLPQNFCNYILRRKLYMHPSKTILCPSSNRHRRHLIQSFGMPPSRLLMLPPVLPASFASLDEKNVEAQRQRFRDSLAGKLGFSSGKRILIQISDSWKIDGVEQTVRAMAALPEKWRHSCILIIAGPAGNREKLLRLAEKYHLEPELIRYAGTGFQERRLLIAADLLLHPAQKPCAAPQLIHAIACHLPIICTALCAYSSHVLAAMCPVIPAPFHQETLEDALVFSVPELPSMRKAMQRCIERDDFTGRAKTFFNTLRNFSRTPEDNTPFSVDFTTKLITLFKRTNAGKECEMARFSIDEGLFMVRRVPDKKWWHLAAPTTRRLIRANRILHTFTPQYRGIMHSPAEKCVYLCARDYSNDTYATATYHNDDEVQSRFSALGQLLGQIHNAGIFLDDARLDNFAFADFPAHECPYRAYLLNAREVIRTTPPLTHNLRCCNVAQLVADTDTLDGITPQMWQNLIASFRNAYQKALYMNEKEARIFWIQVWDIVRKMP